MRTLIVLSILALAACEPYVALDEALGSLDDGPGAPDQPPIHLRGALANLDRTPDADVSICATVLDAALAPTTAIHCATTGLDGTYDLTLPAYTTFEVVQHKEGQLDAVHFFRTGALDTEFYATMLDAATVGFLYTLAGATYDPTRGTVIADAYTRDTEDGTPPAGPGALHPLADMSFGLLASGIQPVYLADNGLPDPALTATTPLGQVGVFGNVPEGDHDAYIKTQPEGTFCGREHLPRGESAGTVRVRVRANTVGGAWFRCFD